LKISANPDRGARAENVTDGHEDRVVKLVALEQVTVVFKTHELGRVEQVEIEEAEVNRVAHRVQTEDQKEKYGGCDETQPPPLMAWFAGFGGNGDGCGLNGEH
jgi:hypothetical protein